jgi:hypothetical protein
MVRTPTNLFQAAWVVNDLEKSIRHWLATTGIGPFFVVPHAKVERILYRGAPATLDMSVGIAQAGPIQIELIQQHNDGPSAYRDMYPKGQEGFHHLCTMTNSFDADVDRYRSQGCAAATQGAFGDMRFVYVDTRASLGHMTEIIEDRDSIKKMFKLIADAAVGWHGDDPIRYL